MADHPQVTHSFDNVSTSETKTVKVTLGNETRDVEVERFSEKHCWHANAAITVRFPSGGKLHTLHRPQVFERNGKWTFGATQSFRNRNNARPFAFADVAKGNSGWTGNEIR